MAPTIAIVGAGVSGLSAAYFLGKLGIRSVLIEKSERLGGLIQTDRVEGCLLEAGPDSFLAAKTSVSDLAQELKTIKDQIIGSNDAARRVFVVRDGRMAPLPSGMAMMVPGSWPSALGSNLFSTRTKLRFVQEIFARPRRREKDISVSDFVQEHFGLELLDYVAEPLLTGVYGGDAAELSVQSVLPRFLAYEEEYGSLIRAVRQQRRGVKQAGSLFRSFRDGMQSLTDAISNAVTDCAAITRAEATRLERTMRGWRVYCREECLAEVDSVVLACPAHTAARLVEREVPSVASCLAAIPYSSAILVTLVHKRPEVGSSLEGFGFLVPRAERRTVAAATFVNTKFPGRIPAGFAAIRGFIVAKQADELATACQSELIALVRADLFRLVGINAEPYAITVHKWPKSMPQYVVGHDQLLRQIRASLRELPNLFVVGNAYEGIGVPDCIRLAKETAKQIAGAANTKPEITTSRE